MAADRKWADFELEDDTEVTDLGQTNTGFQTAPDQYGIKSCITYVQGPRGETIKIVKRVKETRKTQRVNKEVYVRKNLTPFGTRDQDSGDKDPLDGYSAHAPSGASTVRSTEEILLEVPRDATHRFRLKEDEDEDTLLADLNAKTSRDLRQKFRALRGDEEDTMETGDVDGLSSSRGLTKCVTRLRREGADGLRELENRRREECTIRVTNLSEDAKEEDLKELFGNVGKIDRIYLAKHKEKKCSKGFAFITYDCKDSAARAIRVLNRHGYDNLLLNVEWAKPSNRDR